MAITRKVPGTIYGSSSFCPGCGHGVALRLIAEVLEELGQEKKAICALAVGCSCLANRSLGVDMLQCAHGRAAASAAGIKRCRPGHLVFSYQGDGDAGSIGMSETLYSAQRNEKFTQIIINNGVYGMTGGQMSPCTLPGQKTTTSPAGRDPAVNGQPVRYAELLNQFQVAYLARASVHSPREVIRARKFLKRAFEKQMAGEGYTCVEILAPCPTNWNMKPVDAVKRMENEVLNWFPLGELQGGAQ